MKEEIDAAGEATCTARNPAVSRFESDAEGNDPAPPALAPYRPASVILLISSLHTQLVKSVLETVQDRPQPAHPLQ
jgi:hypothetical protein